MRELDFRQPDEAAMERLLAAHPRDRAGVLLRLAWREGLTRDEIVSLTWAQVDFAAALLRLPAREVPLEGETAFCLRALRAGQDAHARVLPMAPQSASRLARRTLDGAGMPDVRLIDLRLDFVRRLLQEHDWPYALRVSGFSVTTYRLVLAQLKDGEAPGAASRDADMDVETNLRAVMDAEGGSAAGLALRLAWDAGLRVNELAALTWDAVDLGAGTLRLRRGTVALPEPLCAALAEERARRAPTDDPHVLLSPRSRRPVSAPRLSALVREALIRGGVEGLSLSDVRCGAERADAERTVLSLARERGSISRGGAARLPGLTDAAANRALRALAASGKLVRVNARYYLPGAVVPPERQAETVREYIGRYGAAYRQDIATLLQLPPRPAARVLRRMADAGELVCDPRTRRYTLP